LRLGGGERDRSGGSFSTFSLERTSRGERLEVIERLGTRTLATDRKTNPGHAAENATGKPYTDMRKVTCVKKGELGREMGGQSTLWGKKEDCVKTSKT